MRAHADPRGSLLLALVVLPVLAACPGNSQVADGGRKESTLPPGSDLEPKTDRPPKTIGANCKPVVTTVVYEDTTDHAGWLPRVAWAGNQYGVVWTQQVEANKYHAAFARVSKDGKLQGSAQFLTKEPTCRTYPGPQVALSGLKDGFVVVWADTRSAAAGSSGSDLYLLRLDGAGQPLDKGTPCSTPGCGQMKLTSSGAANSPILVRPSFIDIDQTNSVSFLGLAWRDDRTLKTIPYPPYISGRGDIYFKVVNIDGTDKVTETRITTDQSKSRPDWPGLAFDGTNYAMVWRDTTASDKAELFYAFVDGQGGRLKPEQSLTVNQGLLSSPPDLVWAGSDYGISFSSNPSLNTGQVKFARITSKGDILAQQKVFEGGAPCTPAVSFNGEHYAIVWQDKCGEEGSQIVFALIDDSGHPLQPDGKSCFGSSDPRCGLVVVPPDAEGTASFPAMISVNGTFAVTWMNAPKRRIQFAQIVCTP
jgi:hypothetical protein